MLIKHASCLIQANYGIITVKLLFIFPDSFLIIFHKDLDVFSKVVIKLLCYLFLASLFTNCIAVNSFLQDLLLVCEDHVSVISLLHDHYM